MLTTSSKGIFRFRYPPRAFDSSMASRAPWSIGMPRASSWLLPPVATETVGMIGPMKPIFTRVEVLRFGHGAARPGVLHLQQEVLLEGLDAAERLDVSAVPA